MCKFMSPATSSGREIVQLEFSFLSLVVPVEPYIEKRHTSRSALRQAMTHPDGSERRLSDLLSCPGYQFSLLYSRLYGNGLLV